MFLAMLEMVMVWRGSTIGFFREDSGELIPIEERFCTWIATCWQMLPLFVQLHPYFPIAFDYFRSSTVGVCINHH
jgi:hypothetical protein